MLGSMIASECLTCMLGTLPHFLTTQVPALCHSVPEDRALELPCSTSYMQQPGVTAVCAVVRDEQHASTHCSVIQHSLAWSSETGGRWLSSAVNTTSVRRTNYTLASACVPWS